MLVSSLNVPSFLASVRRCGDISESCPGVEGFSLPLFVVLALVVSCCLSAVGRSALGWVPPTLTLTLTLLISLSGQVGGNSE